MRLVETFYTSVGNVSSRTYERDSLWFNVNAGTGSVGWMSDWSRDRELLDAGLVRNVRSAERGVWSHLVLVLV